MEKIEKKVVDATILIIQAGLNVLNKKIKAINNKEDLYSIAEIQLEIEEGYIQQEIKEQLDNIMEQEGIELVNNINK